MQNTTQELERWQLRRTTGGQIEAYLPSIKHSQLPLTFSSEEKARTWIIGSLNAHVAEGLEDCTNG